MVEREVFVCGHVCGEWEGALAQCLAHGVIINKAI